MNPMETCVAPAGVPPTAVPYQNRKGTLVAMGVLLIVGGALCGCMSPAALFSTLAPPPPGTHAPQMQFTEMLGIASCYLMMAVACVWLGIGSIQCRRWARALILASSWLCLVIGAISVVTCLVVLPPILSRQVAEANGSMDTRAPVYVGIAVAGVVLFVMIMILNIVALTVSRRRAGRRAAR